MNGKKHSRSRAAIALKYDGENAPRVTAKGRDELADAIMELAREHEIPLHEDRELSALLSQLDLGDAIPRELYVAVAEVIAFAYVLTGKFPKGKGPEDFKQGTPGS